MKLSKEQIEEIANEIYEFKNSGGKDMDIRKILTEKFGAPNEPEEEWWEEPFEEIYGSFQICERVGRKDHDRIIQFIKKIIEFDEIPDRTERIRLLKLCYS